MTTNLPRRWVKRYESATACQAAARNHQWLAGLEAPVPLLRATGARHLEFDHIQGRHATPRDMHEIAGLLGWLHSTARSAELHRSRLDQPFTTRSATHLLDFVSTRRAALMRLSASCAEPGNQTDAVAQAIADVESAADQAACFYKDSNPRNFLIISRRPVSCVAVDFDILTLAPAGYDLAKLLVTLTMTYGLLPSKAVRSALVSYNTALTGRSDLPSVSWDELMAWSNVHSILTRPYLGRGGYRHAWTGWSA